MNKLPERLKDFRAYHAAKNVLLGIANVALPSFDMMTETVKAAGILGEYESPTMGHMQSMKVTLNFRVLTEEQVLFLKPEAHRLDLRGEIQLYDAASGQYKGFACRLVVHGPATKVDLGKFEKSAGSDGSVELEVYYLKLEIGGKTRIEFDRFNYIFSVDGVDYMKSTRSALGL
jgi:uncharacterized protein